MKKKTFIFSVVLTTLTISSFFLIGWTDHTAGQESANCIVSSLVSDSGVLFHKEREKDFLYKSG